MLILLLLGKEEGGVLLIFLIKIVINKINIILYSLPSLSLFNAPPPTLPTMDLQRARMQHEMMQQEHPSATMDATIPPTAAGPPALAAPACPQHNNQLLTQRQQWRHRKFNGGELDETAEGDNKATTTTTTEEDDDGRGRFIGQK
jgi:hypothetical protein